MRYIVKQQKDKLFYVKDTRLDIIRKGFVNRQEAEQSASLLNLREQLFIIDRKDLK